MLTRWWTRDGDWLDQGRTELALILRMPLVSRAQVVRARVVVGTFVGFVAALLVRLA